LASSRRKSCGANGFDRGSSFLGGAINYVTQTGKDSAPLEARVEGGSYGYLKGQLSSGGQYGKFDYFVSATYSQRNGYQKQAAGDSFGLIGNIGIQLADNIETRFFALSPDQEPDARWPADLGNPEYAACGQPAERGARCSAHPAWLQMVRQQDHIHDLATGIAGDRVHLSRLPDRHPHPEYRTLGL
jgi:hypothetical protein